MHRTAELAALASALSEPTMGVVVVHGAAGVGKTALVHAATDPTRLGCEVIWCRGDGSGELPLQPVRRLLTTTGGESSVAVVLHRSVQALAERHRQRPLLVVVDDAHALDPASATFVQLLALARACPLLLTVRTPAPLPDAIGSLTRDGLAAGLELRLFDPTGSAALVTELLGGAVHDSLAGDLWSRCHGNPLHTREVIAAAQARGIIDRREGLWCAVDALPPPSSIGASIRHRLDDVDPETRSLLEFVATMTIVGLPAAEAAFGTDVVDSAERMGLIDVRIDGRREVVLLSHGIVGEVVIDMSSASARRAIDERTLATTDPSLLRRTGDCLRVVHAARRLDRTVDPAIIEGALRDAALAADHPLVESLAALRAATGGVTETAAWADSLLRLGQNDRAEQVLSEIMLDADWVTPITWIRSLNLAFHLGRPDDAETAIASGRSLADDGDQVAFDVMAAMTAMSAGRTAHAAARAASIVEDPELPAPMRAQAWWILGFVAQSQGDVAGTVRAAARDHAAMQEWIAQSPHAPSDNQENRSLLAQSLVCLETGDLATAERHARTGFELGVDTGSPDSQSMFRMALGLAALAAGELATADVMFRHGLIASEAENDRGVARYQLAGLTLVSVARRDLDTARVHCERFDAIDVGAMALLEDYLPVRAAAAVDVLSGTEAGLDRAIELLAAAGARCRDETRWAHEAAVLHDLAFINPENSEATARLAALVGLVDGPLIGLRARHADLLRTVATGSGVDTSSLNSLETLVEEVAGLGHRTLAAQMAFDAARWCEAAGLADRASRMIRTFGPDTAMASTAATALTSREREIAVLASTGASSKEIGEVLFVSARTVDNHLRRVYIKLGVRRRQDLVDHLTTLTD